MDICFKLLNGQSELIIVTREQHSENWLLFSNVQVQLTENATTQNGQLLEIDHGAFSMGNANNRAALPTVSLVRDTYKPCIDRTV
ncbi:hypothetical protein KIN20_003057 [Parelaphostrongylus tenuis]|uniref:Uncharacterized protein n=1 Tax=Parelaphostrongylus tenuis TaxID=148309 RepID=A0AAD5QFT0_PARTN|nr:hypothetical protein KIN20_003057 [Parelaphostrongylus tenuis]